MKRFVEGEDRTQGVLLPEFLDDYVAEDNPVRVIDVFVDELDLHALGFAGVVPEATGRPGDLGGCLPQASGVERDVLQVEGQVRRPRRAGCPAAEGAGDENSKRIRNSKKSR